MKAMITIIILLASAWHYRVMKPEMFQCDLKVYLAAAAGDFQYRIPEHPEVGYVYKTWTARLFYPLTLLDFNVAWNILYAMTTLAYVYIGRKLMEIEFGWALILVGLKFMFWNLHAGNIYVILVALCFTPVGVLVAGLFKPQLLGIGLIAATVEYNRSRRQRSEKNCGR